MKRTIFLLATLLLCLSAFCQPNFLKRLQKGKHQHIVVYGTSLSSGGNGRAWMDVVKARIAEEYGDNLVHYTLAGKGGMWSVWGVKNFEDSVIAKKPDAVFIEFGMNDAFKEYGTSVALAKLNLEYMIDRVRLYSDSCDIFLQVMNMPIGKSAAFRPDLSAYYAMYREVARQKKVMLIDHYTNWQNILDQGEEVFRQYVPDGLHPNKKGGEEVIAPEIIEFLNLNVTDK
ncbi:SGNH/GDSL hydrolase family protein [Sphingobacterium olei]|uniref:SGNH/GDSL hydrolase family protein n=1 Tax=Sphingobacterium olei TaxID=2571155 RepID=A0A4U0NZS2_9SPHI|nr:SGNH/GDSL hydrolase family protein [Sphingobacterium olei]TJZ60421.1 SGNH/GDSL hydrolase family protein [Sphingobacterium olei]